MIIRITLYTLILLTFSIGSRCFGQEIHFSQYEASALTTNPALTGWFNGDCRFSGQYREQWKAIDEYPYVTSAVTFERQHRIYTEQVNYGLMLINDKSGLIGLTTNMAILSGSYLKDFGGHKVQGGVQIGIVNTGSTPDNVTFNSQFDLGEESMFNSNIESGEELQQSKFYPDFNAGILWNYEISDKLIPTIGLAAYHINHPNSSLYDTKSKSSRVQMKSVVHANCKYLISEQIELTPNVLYINQNKATEMLFGFTGGYKLSMPFLTWVYAGAQLRYGMEQNLDATSFLLGFKHMGFDFGISYDYNISYLKTVTNSKGATEFTLRYTCKSSKINSLKSSCDRM